MGDIREALNESIDTIDAGSSLEETPQEVITDAVEGEQDTSAAIEGDQDNTDPEKEGSAESEGDVTSAEQSAEGAAAPHLQDGTDDQEQDTSKNSIKAPVNWGPQEREQWSKIPRPLQEKIMSREKEMADSMANTKEARQTHEQLSSISQSFAPIMAAEGFSTPMEAMQAAFGVMTTMRMGTPQQKAQEIARLIGQYGVDIESLDNVLVAGPQGQAPAAADPQTAALERMLNERLAPVNNLMQQAQQAQQLQQQQRVNQANGEIAKFAEKHEFLADVREDMADIIELASKRGVNVSLEDAYKRACAAHPEISNVISQRERDAQIKGNQQTLDQKRAAASSISGRQLGTGGGGGELSLRDQLNAAFDDAANS